MKYIWRNFIWKALGKRELGMSVIKWKDKIKIDLTAACYGGYVIQ
jgi:hypothetical protein